MSKNCCCKICCVSAKKCCDEPVFISCREKCEPVIYKCYEICEPVCKPCKPVCKPCKPVCKPKCCPTYNVSVNLC
ncbi:hypothetical protein qu_55 [Acanthamoeba polyphaga mimivirus]|nr:hypothetical protein [Mimivirus reunion]WMV61393.1 hypothetical protein qu_55 [Mimivirus sp.]WMV62370.1 hypothetical protein qu_55 [Acanthamoeba polyphaga mimivirus]WMV63347.1 hypothetical protein qu_55 [Mimivirus sp.]